MPEANEIPPMTDPLGAYWKQPARENILLDDKHAVMSRPDFLRLANYSTTSPSGVYPGKMWKAEGPSGGWLLRWYVPDETEPEKYCRIQQREILVVE